MSEAAVRRETFDRVALLTLDRQDRGNVLDGEMLDALLDRVRQLGPEERVRALVLTGAGRHFSLGGSVDEFERALAGGHESALSYCARRTGVLAEVVLALRALPIPVIAAVNGQAAGAGFSLALACDLRVGADTAKLHFAYGMLGASTDGGMSWLLPRAVGPARALALLLRQPVLRAAEAEREGLLSEVVPASDLRARALDLAVELAGNARHSVSAAKRLVHAAAVVDLATHLRDEHRAFGEGLLGADLRAALAARRRGELPTFG